MAVSLNAGPAYGFQLLSLFGVDKDLSAKAEQAGVTIEQSSPGSFAVHPNGGVTCAVVTVKATAITLAKAGSLGPASAAAVKYQFEAALKKALSMSPHQSFVDGSFEEAVKEEELVQTMLKATPAKASPAGGDGVLKLAQASELLQQVAGTSSGSLYTVIALYDGLAVAIRKKPATLSVRAEGKDLALYQAALSEVGLDNNGNYASAHFSVSTPAERKKVVGAILGMIGLGGKAKIAQLSGLL